MDASTKRVPLQLAGVMALFVRIATHAPWFRSNADAVDCEGVNFAVWKHMGVDGC